MKHRVQIASTSHAFTAPDNETVLEAALLAGIHLPYGCRTGRCGACRGKILQGVVRYDEKPAALDQDMEGCGLALFCQARACTDLVIEIDEIEKLNQIKDIRTPAKVARLDRLSHDVMRVCLKLPDNIRLQFFAGQYIDIIQDNGERRSFSIANAPHDDEFIELHIRNIPGGEYTRYIFGQIKPGDIMRIAAPMGGFMLDESSDRPIIMVGGGTGFAPLKGMLEHVFHSGHEKPVHLFRGARSKCDLYLPDLPVAWARQYPLFQYTPILSDPRADDGWEGRTGLVHHAVMQHYPDLGQMDIYISGAPAMVYAARDDFIGKGVPEERIFSDAFEFNSKQEKVTP
ncbi:MAG TPA: CDP-6-deoxy-delta-3,4-glucoseen reductase [Gammaproteobacteria bacterium]|nr:CDP-6-deoxy-delta-3,4-glucoseen reductase [Gammaproteobacteria bacterium]